MAKYNILKQLLLGLKLVSSLPKDIAKELGDIFGQLSVGDGPQVIIKKIQDNEKLRTVNAVLLVDTIPNLIMLSKDAEASIDQFIDDLVESYVLQEKEITKEQQDALSSNIKILINSSKNIELTLKASNLLTEFEKTFQDSRIVTDIRLLFPDSVKEGCQQAVIVHNLKIDYRKNNEQKSIYIALDVHDLISLKGHLEKAIEKEQVIREKNKLQNIDYIKFNLN